MSSDLKQNCQCACGKTKFTIHQKPIIRIFCHCRICQEFNNAAYADVTMYLLKDVQLEDEAQVSFKKYTPSSSIRRGKCVACGKPAIEFLESPLLPSLAIVPSENIAEKQNLTEPSAHIFYHRSIGEVNDEYPKYSGSLKSQVMLARNLLPGLFARLLNKQGSKSKAN